MPSRPLQLPETAPLMWVDYLVLALLASVTGWAIQRGLDVSIFATRELALTNGAALCIPVFTFLFARAVAGRFWALVVVIASMVAPQHLPDSRVWALGSLSVWCLWLAVERDSPLLTLFSALGLVAASLMELTGALELAGAVALWCLVTGSGLCSGPSMKRFVTWLTAFVLVAVPAHLLTQRGWQAPALRDEHVFFSSWFDLASAVALAGLLVSGLRSRDGREMMMAAWVVILLAVRLLTTADAPFSAVPAAFVAWAVMLRDAFALARLKPRR